MNGHDYDRDVWRIAAILLDTYGVCMVTEAMDQASRRRVELEEGGDAEAAGLWGKVFLALLELMKAEPEAGDLVH